MRKKVKGRAYKRMIYNRRYANLVAGAKAKSPNFNAGRKVVDWEHSIKIHFLLQKNLLIF